MKARQLTFVFLTVAAAFFGVKFLIGPRPHRHALEVRAVATRGLAEYLAATQPGKRVVVISNPFTRRAGTDRAIVEMEDAGLRGLREGFGEKLPISAVAFPELRPEARDNPRAVPIDAETTTPLSYLVATDAVDAIVRNNAGCDIVVSLIGLPAELGSCEAWHRSGGPAFALLLPDLRMVGDRAAIEGALKSGKLLAFVARKPGGPGDDIAPGKDTKAEFERRFLLVTRENVEQVAQIYPGLF